MGCKIRVFLKQDESERAFRETCLYVGTTPYPSPATSDTLRGAGQGGAASAKGLWAPPGPIPHARPQSQSCLLERVKPPPYALRERTFPRPSLALHVALEMRMERRLGRADGDALPVGQDGGLDGGAVGDRLLRGDVAVWLAPVELLP